MKPYLTVVRLGEHDTRTTTDGKHQDIRVIKDEPHEEFSRQFKINDIAIVYLEDVTFNGEQH